MTVVAGVAALVLAIFLLLATRAIVNDPSNDGTTLAFMFVILIGISWLAFPVIVEGVGFWANLLAEQTSP